MAKSEGSSSTVGGDPSEYRRKVADVNVTNEITGSPPNSVPVVILADTDELAQILKALEYGARGYIPTSVGIEVCAEAIGLAMAGGIFVPASSVLALRHMLNAGLRRLNHCPECSRIVR